MHGLLFRSEYKPRGYYLEHFWQADMGYIGHAIIGVKVPNSSHVACIQNGRVAARKVNCAKRFINGALKVQSQTFRRIL